MTNGRRSIATMMMMPRASQAGLQRFLSRGPIAGKTVARAVCIDLSVAPSGVSPAATNQPVSFRTRIHEQQAPSHPSRRRVRPLPINLARLAFSMAPADRILLSLACAL
jgi:hypothetical protein